MTIKNSISGLGQAPAAVTTKSDNVAKRSAGNLRRSEFAWVRTLMGSDTQGGALVEMAVTLPLVLGILTGIMSFSIALYQKMEVAEAVSAGGRVLALERGDTDPCAKVAAAIYAAEPGLTQGSYTLTFKLNGVSTGASCPGAGGTANADMVSGGTAQVVAKYPCSLNVYGIKYSTCTLASQVTETVQ